MSTTCTQKSTHRDVPNFFNGYPIQEDLKECQELYSLLVHKRIVKKAWMHIESSCKNVPIYYRDESGAVVNSTKTHFMNAVYKSRLFTFKAHRIMEGKYISTIHWRFRPNPEWVHRCFTSVTKIIKVASRRKQFTEQLESYCEILEQADTDIGNEYFAWIISVFREFIDDQENQN